MIFDIINSKNKADSGDKTPLGPICHEQTHTHPSKGDVHFLMRD